MPRSSEATPSAPTATPKLSRASAASQYVRQLVEGKRIALEYDQNNAAQGHTDRYGRTLAYVWTASENGNRLLLINCMLMRAGYAHAYLDYPTERGEEFLELER